jgi:hypothetical protein
MWIQRLAIGLIAGSAVAAEPDNLAQSLQACLVVSDATQRLACFEAVARSASATPSPSVTKSEPALNAKPTPPIETPIAEPAYQPPANSEAEFGREQEAAAKRAGERLISTLTAVDRSAYDQLRVTLANGQSWEQVGTDTYQLAVGDQIVIERGALHSFFLHKESANRKVRFRRID